jgi:hypothetical protein
MCSAATSDCGTSNVRNSNTKAPSCSAGPTVAPSIQKPSATGSPNTPSPPDYRPYDYTTSDTATPLPRCAPVKVVSERLGHTSVAFTQQVYMHVIPGMDAEGARLAATAILGTMSTPNPPGDPAVTNSVTTRSDSPLL